MVNCFRALLFLKHLSREEKRENSVLALGDEATLWSYSPFTLVHVRGVQNLRLGEVNQRIVNRGAVLELQREIEKRVERV